LDAVHVIPESLAGRTVPIHPSATMSNHRYRSDEPAACFVHVKRLRSSAPATARPHAAAWLRRAVGTDLVGKERHIISQIIGGCIGCLTEKVLGPSVGMKRSCCDQIERQRRTLGPSLLFPRARRKHPEARKMRQSSAFKYGLRHPHACIVTDIHWPMWRTLQSHPEDTHPLKKRHLSPLRGRSHPVRPIHA